jgi:dephospho-CoA kinase
MMLVGLTGSIGMGKSETAKMFAGEGVPVYDADAAVHALYAKGGDAVAPIGAAFPEAVKDGAVDRVALSKAVLGKPEAFKKLESIIHPLVAKVQLNWLEAQRRKGADIVVLDIPLLFETGGEARVDKVVVVSAPAEVQRTRVLARPEMTPEKFEAILAKQVPDAEKRAKADYVVDTSRGLDDARAQVRTIIKDLRDHISR